MKQIKGILIDPFTQTVTEVVRDRGLSAIYEKVGCDIVEAVYLKNGDCIYVDEEGTYGGHCEKDGKKYGFQIGNDGIQLLGRGLVTGTTIYGNDANCKTRVDGLGNIYWFRVEGGDVW